MDANTRLAGENNLPNSETDTSTEGLVTKVSGLVLKYQPSACEFVPGHPDFFVVGTYHLDNAGGSKEQQLEDTQDDDESIEVVKEEQRRSGALLLYHFSTDEQQLICISTEATSDAVTDLRFCPQNSDYFVITCTDGSVSCYTILWQSPNPQLLQISTFSLFETIALSCTWNRTHPGLMVVTLQDGSVHLLQWQPDYTQCQLVGGSILQHKSRFTSHEAWIATFSTGNTVQANSESSPCSVFSGGDDSMLRSVPLTSYPIVTEDGSAAEEYTEPGTELAMKGHTAGVTAILPIPLATHPGQEILITGSYDDHIRIVSFYDHQARVSHPKVLTELNLGGGVWKLKLMEDYGSQAAPKPEERKRYLVLAACMHAGARVVEVVGSMTGEWTMRVLGRFEEHKSMCYAADVRPNVPGERRDYDLCVSTSFYDRLLAVWKFEDSVKR